VGLEVYTFNRYIKYMVTTISRAKKIRCFLEGYSSIFDINGRGFTTEYNDELSGFQKDYMAMLKDWQNLGNDMRKAINQEKAINQGSYVRQP
jgi:hypothetical protein